MSAMRSPTMPFASVSSRPTTSAMKQARSPTISRFVAIVDRSAATRLPGQSVVSV